MKKYVLILLLPLLAFMSCDNDDGYSLDDFWVGMATVDNPEGGPYFYLTLDDNEKLWIVATNLLNYRPQTGQRILADFTILNDKPEGSAYDHDVRLNDAYNVLTKRVIDITPAMQDSIGNDPIQIRDVWVGSDYINIRFLYQWGNRQHMLNLVRDVSKEYNDGRVHLEFRHNAYEDTQNRTAGGLVSFDAKPLQRLTTGDELPLTIHVRTGESQERTYDLTYEFGEESDSNRTFDRELFTSGKELDIE